MTDNDYIYEVYKEKSFSIAAKNLFISQPALSSSVKKVEKELGITIFDRSTSPITLTEAGKVYIESIEKIRKINTETKTRLHDLTNLREGHITIGGENYVSSFIIPEIILTFSKKYPNIKIELIESNSPDLKLQLLNESIDILIGHDFNSSLYSSVPLFREIILLAVPKHFEINETLSSYALSVEDIINDKHLDSKTPSVKLEWFKNTPFILMKKGNDTRKRSNILFEEQNFKPENVVMNLDQLITSYNMANYGIGVAFISDKIIKTTSSNNLIFYKLSGTATQRYVDIGYKKNKYMSNAIKEFILTAKEIYTKK